MSSILDFIRRKGEKPAAQPGPEETEQKEMILGVQHLSERIAKEVMVPRTDTVFLESDATREEMLRLIVESGHSRIPVYRETMDNVIGVVYAKDVLAAMVGDREFSIASIMRKPYFVPESKRIDKLLHEFKRKHVHIAIVVDEYGGTSGIVCMEDIIEEIVGQIQDEYDDETEEIIQIGPQTWLCDARVRLADANGALGLHFPEEEFDSLAGYVFDIFGRIPAENESMETDEAIFTVQEMEAHRIKSLRIEKKLHQRETGDEGELDSDD